MDVDAYIDRINYHGSLAPSYQTVAALQRAHMLSVPFENLDIVPLHRPIRLDLPALWDKIVERRRGGFCYELNGLFAWLLAQCGFDVTHLNARVFTGAGTLGIDFDHLALAVQVRGKDDRWLADVGFGDSFLEPLRFGEGDKPQGLRTYRLEKNTGGYIVWQRDYDGAWKRLYFFDLAPRAFPSDYKPACAFHQRSPDSHFTRNSIVTRATENGRISLEQDRLIVTEDGVRKESAISPQEWPALLREHFGVVL